MHAALRVAVILLAGVVIGRMTAPVQQPHSKLKPNMSNGDLIKFHTSPRFRDSGGEMAVSNDLLNIKRLAGLGRYSDAITLAMQTKGDETKFTRLMEVIAREFVCNDSVAAFGWGLVSQNFNAPEVHFAVVTAMFEAIAEKNPQEALQWIAKSRVHFSKPLEEAVESTVARTWAESDPVEAIKWSSQLSTTTPSLTAIEVWSINDPQAAFQHANEITEHFPEELASYQKARLANKAGVALPATQ